MTSIGTTGNYNANTQGLFFSGTLNDATPTEAPVITATTEEVSSSLVVEKVESEPFPPNYLYTVS